MPAVKARGLPQVEKFQFTSSAAEADMATPPTMAAAATPHARRTIFMFALPWSVAVFASGQQPGQPDAWTGLQPINPQT